MSQNTRPPLGAVMVALAAATFLTGCSTDPAADPADAKEITFISGNAPNAFFVTMGCAMQAEAEKLGVDLTVTGPPSYSATEQVPIVSSVAATSPDGVIVAPTDPDALIAPLKEITSTGAPLVEVDTVLTDTSLAAASLSSDNKGGGAAALDLLAEQLGSTTGKVLLIDLQPGAGATNLRAEGVQEQAAKYPDLELLPVQYDNNQAANDAQIVASTIAANPDLVGIITTGNSPTLGAIPAIKEAGLTGSIKLIGFDADAQILDAIRAGDVSGVMAQQVGEMGRQALLTMVSALDGEKVERDLTIPMKAITPETIDTPEGEALAYKDAC